MHRLIVNYWFFHCKTAVAGENQQHLGKSTSWENQLPGKINNLATTKFM